MLAYALDFFRIKLQLQEQLMTFFINDSTLVFSLLDAQSLNAWAEDSIQNIFVRLHEFSCMKDDLKTTRVIPSHKHLVYYVLSFEMICFECLSNYHMFILQDRNVKRIKIVITCVDDFLCYSRNLTLLIISLHEYNFWCYFMNTCA